MTEWIPAKDEVTTLAQRARQLKQCGQLEEALTVYHQAIAIDPVMPALWFNCGNLLQQLHRLSDAESAYRQALEIQANFFQAHLNLANLLRDRGDSEVAIVHYRQAIHSQPSLSLAYRNLGQLLLKLQRLDAALEVFTTWLRVEPGNPGALNGIGIIQQNQGQLETALSTFQRALALDPHRSDTLNNLGTLLRMLHRPHEALPHLRKAVTQDPQNDTMVANLVHTLLNLGYVSEALHQVQSLLKDQPQSAVGHLFHGYALVLQARITEAIACFEQCWQLDSTATIAVSNALFALLYQDEFSAPELTKQLKTWAKRLPVPKVKLPTRSLNLTSDRCLKVGYLSADLRSHPVSFFLEPILRHHNPAAVEVTCYDTGSVEDATTQRLRSLVPQWRSCSGLSDAALAQQIAQDQIDILVDLSGHTQNNRASVLGCRPAPIQMLYIGYPSTTGMDTVDYIISDAAVSPPEYESLYTEQVLRVEGSFWCFKPHDFAPDPGPLPALQNGWITFGSCNNSPKLSSTTLRLWVQVLASVPQSRLLLKTLAFADEETQAYFRRPFLEAGIAPQRLLFEKPTLDLTQFLEVYQRIDIALDTFPYNGGTTTCEALWMGVPIVTLQGQPFCSRMSHSFLRHLGLSDLSSATEAGYVAAARSLAEDSDRLQHLRTTLRSLMATSPICDGEQAARSLEKAYRQAWLNLVASA